MPDRSHCLWCGGIFKAIRRGNQEKKFCSDKCRHDFETAARRYAVRMLELELLTIEALKQGAGKARREIGER